MRRCSVLNKAAAAEEIFHPTIAFEKKKKTGYITPIVRVVENHRKVGGVKEKNGRPWRERNWWKVVALLKFVAHDD
jgi:hypothetical protein